MARHRDAPRCAIEELYTQFIFERLNAAAQRRLTQMHTLGSTRKTPLLSQRDKMEETSRVDVRHSETESQKMIKRIHDARRTGHRT